MFMLSCQLLIFAHPYGMKGQTCQSLHHEILQNSLAKMSPGWVSVRFLDERRADSKLDVFEQQLTVYDAPPGPPALALTSFPLTMSVFRSKLYHKQVKLQNYLLVASQRGPV